MSVLEIIENKQNNKISIYKPIINVLPLNDSQKTALKEVEKNTLTTVIGAAGTGKTSFIVNLASHFIMNNKKVLIVSKSEHAVNVVTDKLNALGCGKIAMRGGKYNSMIELTSYLMDLLENKIDLTKEKTNILKYFLLNKSENEAKKILKNKRISDLEKLLSDYSKRKNLLIQAKSNTIKNKNQKEKIREKIDFDSILEALPCFCVTSNDISNLIPLKKEMFDIVIADESSEMDIASFIPCMYRAKKAVIVGDDKQLKSLLWMDSKKNKSFMTKYEIPADLELVWNYKDNSLFDFAQYYTEKCIILNEQYRMPENLFRFSNNMFYGGIIKSHKKADNEALKKVLVKDGKTDECKTYNFKEAEAIILKIKELIKKDDNKTIAVLSPFKSQVELIQKLIMEIIPYNEIDKHNIQVLTANGSQGNEFDICLISWCYADNSKHQTKTFLNNPERFNVITTRAKEQLINYYSTEKLGDCLLNQYLSNIEMR